MKPAELNDYRLSLGMNGKQLAAYLGVTGACVSLWLAGKSPIPEMAIKLINSLRLLALEPGPPKELEDLRCYSFNPKAIIPKGTFRTQNGRVDNNGYIYLFCPNHPNARVQGYVAEHRLVMEAKIGRFLENNEVVHHIDQNKKNNNIGNLMLFPSSELHSKFHRNLKEKPALLFDTIPEGFCQCGCGQAVAPSAKTRTSRGLKKGDYPAFISGHNITVSGKRGKVE
jgi:hypothetical protein